MLVVMEWHESLLLLSQLNFQWPFSYMKWIMLSFSIILSLHNIQFCTLATQYIVANSFVHSHDLSLNCAMKWNVTIFWEQEILKMVIINVHFCTILSTKCNFVYSCKFFLLVVKEGNLLFFFFSFLIFIHVICSSSKLLPLEITKYQGY